MASNTFIIVTVLVCTIIVIIISAVVVTFIYTDKQLTVSASPNYDMSNASGTNIDNPLTSNDPRFPISIGLNDDAASLSIINTIDDVSKNTCSNACFNNSSCIGYMYNNNNCELLSNLTIFKNGNILTNNRDIYLRSIDKIKFNDRIFLSAFDFTIPKNFWNVSSRNNFQQVTVNSVYKINFFPKVVKTYNSLIGIYSPYKFDLGDIPLIIKNGTNDNYYLHYSNNILKIPSIWKFMLPLYVAYVKN